MQRKTYNEKRTEQWQELCHRFNLAIEQSKRARAHGRSDIADGLLRHAREILLEIREHVRRDQHNALLKERCEVSAKLHAAIAGGQKRKASELSSELVRLDAMIAAA